MALAVAVAVLTFLAEAVGIGIVFNVSPLRVLEMAFDFDPYSIRPGWLVLGAGLIVAAVDWIRARFAKPRRSRQTPQPPPSRCRPPRPAPSRRSGKSPRSTNPELIAGDKLRGHTFITFVPVHF